MYIAILIGFCVALLLIALKYKNATLDQLPLLNSEDILFEETTIKVKQSGIGRSQILHNCFIRVTDKRIIIAQKMLLQKKYALRFVFHYTGITETTDLGSSLKKGYLIAEIKRADISVAHSAAGCTVKIEIPDSTLTKNQFITYNTSTNENYKIFQ